MIGVDTETCLILPGILAPPLVCLSYSEGPGRRGLFHRTDPDLREVVEEIFEGESTWANAPFDLAVLLAWDESLTDSIFDALEGGRIHDVQTREKLIDLAAGTLRYEEDEEGEIRFKGYSLAEIGERHGLGGKVHDEWRLRYHDLFDTPLIGWPKEAVYYAIRDAELTHQIHEKQERQAGAFARKNLEWAAATVRAHVALHLASCRGIRTHAGRVRELAETCRKRCADLLPGLVADGLARPDGTRSVKAAVRRMIEVLGPGFDVEALTDTGVEIFRGTKAPPDTEEGRAFKAKPSIDTFRAMALAEGKWVSVGREAVATSEDPVLLRYSEYAQERSLLTGTIEDLRRGVETPIQSRFEPVLHSLRTSSSKPNIQNLRRREGIRECFTPRDGHVFVSADFKAAELHTWAQTCLDLFGESDLAVALNNGDDPHLRVGADLLSVDYDTAISRYEAGDEAVDQARFIAKKGNFGFSGGMSPRRFAAIVRSDGRTFLREAKTDEERERAHRLIAFDDHQGSTVKGTWLRTWREARRYLDHKASQIDDRGWQWAMHPRTGVLRSRCTYCASCNHDFQHLCAVAAKAALWEVCRRQRVVRDSALFGTYTVNFVHDDVLIECPEEIADPVAREFSACMTEAFNRFVPDVPTIAEAKIMRFWSRKAKVVERDGVLLPWPEREAAE